MKIKAAIIHVSDCCSDSVVAAIMFFFSTGTSQTVVMGCDHFQTSLFFFNNSLVGPSVCFGSLLCSASRFLLILRSQTDVLTLSLTSRPGHDAANAGMDHATQMG